ncbi:MAG: ABC transporter permease subunit [Pseudomonadota bacterium]
MNIENPILDADPTRVAEKKAETLKDVETFVRTRPQYYADAFDRIRSRAGFVPTLNVIAGLMGPVWFGARGLWKWAVGFLIVETLAFVQLIRGLFGDLGAEARERIASIEGTLDFRRQQLEAALEQGSDRVPALQRAVDGIESNIASFRAEAAAAEAQGIWIALAGLILLVLAKTAQAFLANSVLEARFSDWLSDQTIPRGMPERQIILSAVFSAVIIAVAVVHYSFPGAVTVLAEFPTDPDIRLTVIGWVEAFFSFAVTNGEALFEAITYCIRLLLDALEVVFVSTPWIVVAAFIVLMTWLSAGVTTAVYAGAFLAYMGLLGFWDKAMTTLALLGTAACLSITIGIPLGMFCARRPRLYSFVQPVMDFMQTMPAFVFMIPVIAFFGTGKPAAVVTTMIFGGTPVVRLTVLGLRGVPEHVREAALSFGASKWYLLTRVDLPLAAPSIRAGINQTIMLSLAMVVVASLIGAKGLGEDVLEALQYANVGQGILAGFAILFCAMILDRIVQGKRE